MRFFFIFNLFSQIFSILETDRRRRRSDSRGRSDRGRRDDARKDDRRKNDDKKKEPEVEKSADKIKKDPEPVKEAAKSLIAPDEPAPPGEEPPVDLKAALENKDDDKENVKKEETKKSRSRLDSYNHIFIIKTNRFFENSVFTEKKDH